MPWISPRNVQTQEEKMLKTHPSMDDANFDPFWMTGRPENSSITVEAFDNCPCWVEMVWDHGRKSKLEVDSVDVLVVVLSRCQYTWCSRT